MKIEKIEIKGLFGKKDICWELNPQVNVLVGENGTGKSTILLVLYEMLHPHNFSDKYFKLLNTASLIFSNGGIITVQPSSDAHQQVLSSIIKQRVPNLRTYTPKFKFTIELNEIAFDFLDILYIDFISTEISNSNANHVIQKSSNQTMSNILDMEIRDTIYELNKIANSELINRLSGSLNFFFNPIGKQVTYENNEWVYTDTQLQKTLNYSDLSSGERQLIYILLRVALSNGDKSKTAIILMDEPEISLHLNWQAHFIKQLTLLNPNAQFIIVTHSPALIMNGWNDVYVNMKDITQ